MKTGSVLTFVIIEKVVVRCLFVYSQHIVILYSEILKNEDNSLFFRTFV